MRVEDIKNIYNKRKNIKSYYEYNKNNKNKLLF